MGDPDNMDTASIASSLMNDLDSNKSIYSVKGAEPIDPLLKKCCRKGDKIYYSNSEHIRMMQERKNSGDKTKSSFDATNQVDKVLSGESLYKKFSFEQGSNDEDTEKCIAFWKTVMEKNLVPIKCTIMENIDDDVVQEIADKDSVISKNDVTAGKIRESKIHEHYKTTWQTALRELQRRRLHEIKLLGKTRCKMCESVSSSVNDSQDISKSIKEEVVQLNEWQPVVKEKGPQGSTGVNRLQISGQRSVCNCCGFANCTCKSEEIPSVDTLPDGIEGQGNGKTYRFVDVIQRKKGSGAYCEWRSNKVRDPCPCDYSVCDCNRNPAILSITPAAARPPPKGPCVCGAPVCECQENLYELEIAESKYNVSDRSVHEDDPRFTTVSPLKSGDWESVCDCGNPNCDCHKNSSASLTVPRTVSSGKHTAGNVEEEQEHVPTTTPEQIEQESLCVCGNLDCTCNDNRIAPSVDTVIPEVVIRYVTETNANTASNINAALSHGGVGLLATNSNRTTQSEEKMVEVVDYEKKGD